MASGTATLRVRTEASAGVSELRWQPLNVSPTTSARSKAARDIWLLLFFEDGVMIFDMFREALRQLSTVGCMEGKKTPRRRRA